MSRVLLADDDADLLAVLGKVLRDHGHSVTSTNNGGDALALLQGHAGHDLVILDMKMPVLNGWDVLALRPQAGPPVIVMTGLQDAVEGLRSALWGGKARRVLRKPFTLEQFLAAVGDVLDGREGAGGEP